MCLFQRCGYVHTSWDQSGAVTLVEQDLSHYVYCHVLALGVYEL